MNALFKNSTLSSFTASIIVAVIFLAGLTIFPSAGLAKDPSKAEVGEKAPDFQLKDVNGKLWSLSKLKDKVVVLEWFNFGCPFVKKHYDTGNMQSLQKRFVNKGVVWLCICSSAEGRQGYKTAKEHIASFKKKESAPSAVLIDADGKVGKLYGAKTTPHMYIIGKDGALVYAGAIDDNPGFNKEEIKSAKNYVKIALNEILAGEPVSKSETKAYGCSVKYKK